MLREDLYFRKEVNMLDLILAIGSLVVAYLLGVYISKLSLEKKEKMNFVLQFIEGIITINPDWAKLTWKNFYKKITDALEKSLKFDLSDDDWEKIEAFLLEQYNKMKEELNKEENP